MEGRDEYTPSRRDIFLKTKNNKNTFNLDFKPPKNVVIFSILNPARPHQQNVKSKCIFQFLKMEHVCTFSGSISVFMGSRW